MTHSVFFSHAELLEHISDARREGYAQCTVSKAHCKSPIDTIYKLRSNGYRVSEHVFTIVVQCSEDGELDVETARFHEESEVQSV